MLELYYVILKDNYNTSPVSAAGSCALPEASEKIGPNSLNFGVQRSSVPGFYRSRSLHDKGLAVRCQNMGGRTASLTTRKPLNTIVPESSLKARSAIPLLTYRLSESLVVTAKQGIITGRLRQMIRTSE